MLYFVQVAVAKNYHAVRFYKDEESLARTVATFLAEGFRQGEPAVIVATPGHAVAVYRELSALGLEHQKLRQSGALEILDAETLLFSFMIDGVPDPVAFRKNMGDVIDRVCAGRKPCPIRVYGEMVDVLWQDGNQDGAIRLEILWNQLAADFKFSLLCGYSVGQFYKETRDPRYQQVCEQHSHVIEDAPGQ